VRGTLGLGPRGPFIITEAGDYWILNLDGSMQAVMGKRVTLEGSQAGYDRLSVEWMGDA
jgi:hypothetical protein